jgi:hypothetical protein
MNEQKTDATAADVLPGLTRTGALRLEMAIIGLGLVGLVLIFQPISITLFAIGSAIVVLAGLVNNLLPLAQPGVRPRTIITVALVVAMIFSIVLLVSMTAAHLYGGYFLSPPPSAVPSPPFYMDPFTWGVAATAVVLVVLVAVLNITDRHT